MSDKTIDKIIYELVGSASLCWEPKPHGVFDSTMADKFSKDALSDIRRLIEAIPATEAKYMLPDGSGEAKSGIRFFRVSDILALLGEGEE